MMFIRSVLLILVVLPTVLSKKRPGKSSTKSAKSIKPDKPKGSKFLKESFRLVGGGPPTLSTAVGPVVGTDEVVPLPVGGLFILKGFVENFDSDAFFTLTCTALDGSDSVDGIITFTKAKCELDVCIGIDEVSGDPDCIYLRFSGAIEVAIDFNVGQLNDVAPFKGAVTGGSGRYLLSTGQAVVTQQGPFINLDLITIPSVDIPLFDTSVIVT